MFCFSCTARVSYHRLPGTGRHALSDGFDACRDRRPRIADGSCPAAEPRGRGVRSRRDAALADRDRRGHRDSRRLRLLPRVARDDLSRRARSVGEGRARRCDHARERARGARRARAGRRQRADRRAGGARPRDGERRALRPDRQGDGDAARLVRAGSRDRAPRAASGRARPPTSSTAPSRSSSISRSSGSRATSRTSSSCSRRASSGSRSCTRRASTSRASRRGFRDLDRLTSGLPARQPDHPRGASVDGEVGARALHGREPRRARSRSLSRCSRSRCRSPR